MKRAENELCIDIEKLFTKRKPTKALPLSLRQNKWNCDSDDSRSKSNDCSSDSDESSSDKEDSVMNDISISDNNFKKI